MATLAIAIHTFAVIVFRWTPPRSMLLPAIVISGIWLFVGLYVGISVAQHSSVTSDSAYFAPAGFWCWISARYPADRISAEYVWLWVAALLSVVLYIPLYFCIRGNLEVDPARPWVWSWRAAPPNVPKDRGFDAVAQARKMLAYPACYIVIVAPLSVARWIGFSDGNVIAPFWTFFGVFLFGLSGIVNVLLLTLTRPTVLTFGRSHATHHDRTLYRSDPLRFELSGRRSRREPVGTDIDFRDADVESVAESVVSPARDKHPRGPTGQRRSKSVY